MSSTVQYSEAEGIIEAVFKGIVNIKIAEEALPDIMKLCQQNNCYKLLIDLTEAEMKFSVIEVVNKLPTLIDDKGSEADIYSRRLRRAIVAPMTEDLKFYENAFVNRGYTAKIFNERIPAIKWLQGR